MYRRIRNLREDKDMTQTEVAKMLTMSQTGYSKYETGENDIPTNILIRRFITGPLHPTAACPELLSNFPTTATSTELNSCCKIELSARGIAKSRSLSSKLPFSISTLLLLFFIALPSFIQRKICNFFPRHLHSSHFHYM